MDKFRRNQYYQKKREESKNYQKDNFIKIKEIKNAYFRAIQNDNLKKIRANQSVLRSIYNPTLKEKKVCDSKNKFKKFYASDSFDSDESLEIENLDSSNLIDSDTMQGNASKESDDNKSEDLESIQIGYFYDTPSESNKTESSYDIKCDTDFPPLTSNLI